jgi:vacuolar protein sorting-associated protein 45
VSVVGELSRLVDLHDILNVSEAEQEMACQSNHTEVLQKVRSLLANDKVCPKDKMRLVMLYALRYEKHGSSALLELVDLLTRAGVDENDRKILTILLRCVAAGWRF